MIRLDERCFYVFVDQHNKNHGCGRVLNDFGDTTALWYFSPGANKGGKGSPDRQYLDLKKLVDVDHADRETSSKPKTEYVSYPEFVTGFYIEAEFKEHGKYRNTAKVHTYLRRSARTSEQMVKIAKERAEFVLSRIWELPLAVVKKHFEEYPDHIRITGQ